MAIAFRLKHAWEYDPVRVTVDSSAVLVRGDLCRLVPGDKEIVKATTNNAYSYIAMEASADGSTAPILCHRLKDNQRLVATVSSGTPSSTTPGTGGYVDITSTGVTTTASNNDLLAFYNGTTDTVDVECINVL